ncbi:MAG: cytochrome c [Pirellulales bacterium]|nr:cytochrome c [Pirellulales bacterium]
MPNLRLPNGFLLVALLLVTVTTFAKDPPQRAKPCAWSQDVLDAFFADARQHLLGERPSPRAAMADDRRQSPPPVVDSDTSSISWSELVSAETLTAEIKRLNIALATSLARPAQFKGGGNLQCRRDFSTLAVVFGVISEYGSEVRWKKSAPLIKNHCLLASELCESGTDESYAAAKKARQVLNDLIRGQPVELPAKPPAGGSLANFSQVMQRMEQGLEENVSPSLASARQFRSEVQTVVHDAQLLAALAQAICHENYEYGTDPTYLGFAIVLREACRELHQATSEVNYNAARAAVGKVSQSCSDCHEAYRG